MVTALQYPKGHSAAFYSSPSPRGRTSAFVGADLQPAPNRSLSSRLHRSGSFAGSGPRPAGFAFLCRSVCSSQRNGCPERDHGAAQRRRTLSRERGWNTDPVYMSRKIRKFRTDKFRVKQTEILTHATHVNGCFPAVYMSCMSQNFRLFHVSNLSVRNFRIFPLMYTGSLSPVPYALHGGASSDVC